MTTLTARISELEAHVGRLAALAVDAHIAGQGHAVEELEALYGAAVRDAAALRAELHDVDVCTRCHRADADGLGLDAHGVCWYCQEEVA